MKEAEIIQLCKKGDPKGFRKLVDSYAPQLMAVCQRYISDEFTAKDVLQESFIRIFKNIGKYQEKGSFEAWLRRIVITSALMEIRKQKRDPFKSNLGMEQSQLLDQHAEVDLSLNESDILAMIHELPEHYRVIFNLYVIEGYNHKEIAALLDIGESTSRTKLTRARVKMQEIYRKKVNWKENKKNKIIKVVS